MYDSTLLHHLEHAETHLTKSIELLQDSHLVSASDLARLEMAERILTKARERNRVNDDPK